LQHFRAQITRDLFAAELRALLSRPVFGRTSSKEVTPMIKKLQKLLFPALRRRSGSRQFNRPLLERQREDVFVLMHQQMGGMR
jgi:hypothetical protein